MYVLPFSYYVKGPNSIILIFSTPGRRYDRCVPFYVKFPKPISPPFHVFQIYSKFYICISCFPINWFLRFLVFPDLCGIPLWAISNSRYFEKKFRFPWGVLLLEKGDFIPVVMIGSMYRLPCEQNLLYTRDGGAVFWLGGLSSFLSTHPSLPLFIRPIYRDKWNTKNTKNNNNNNNNNSQKIIGSSLLLCYCCFDAGG
jgi:hypothetical protein